MKNLKNKGFQIIESPIDSPKHVEDVFEEYEESETPIIPHETFDEWIAKKFWEMEEKLIHERELWKHEEMKAE